MVRNGKAYDITPGMADDAVAVLRVAMVVLTSILAKSVYIDLYLGDNKDLWPYLAVGIIAAFLSHLVFGAGAPRKAGRSRTVAALFVHVAMALALTFLILISIGYLLKIAETYSRGWMITWFVFAIVGVGCVELIGGRLRRLLGARGYFKRRVAIYGAGETATRLLAHLVQDQADIEIVGVWDDAAPNASRADIAGGLADLVRLARDNKVDHVVLAGAAANPGRIEAVLDDLTQLPINIHLASDFISFSLVEPSFLKLGNANLVEIQAKPLTGWSPWKKALVDYVFACLFLILASPLIAVVALAIKLDSPGPVFFRQRRHGFNNQEIDVIKFRTMYVGSGAQNGVVEQATRDDPRVTRVGRILRATSLDEMPQLINVLRGEMSITGPRPHAVEHNLEYGSRIEHYASRHKIKPGITGWAQVNGYRGETDVPEKMRKRIEYDIFYIENWSVAFDLKIIFLRTIPALLSRQNAY